MRTRLAYISLGLVVGVAIGWIARSASDGAVDSAPATREPPKIAENSLPNDSESAPELAVSSSQTSGLSASTSGVPRDNEPSVIVGQAQDAPGISQSPTSSAERAGIPISDAHASFVHRQFTTDEATGESRTVREIFEEEAYDDSWSYFMEQALRQFVSNHAEAAKFSIFHIECRTSMCEIQAIGFDDSTGSYWSRILYDLSLEAWYDFGEVGTYSNDYQGQLAILTRLKRAETKSAPVPSS